MYDRRNEGLETPHSCKMCEGRERLTERKEKKEETRRSRDRERKSNGKMKPKMKTKVKSDLLPCAISIVIFTRKFHEISASLNGVKVIRSDDPGIDMTPHKSDLIDTYSEDKGEINEEEDPIYIQDDPAGRSGTGKTGCGTSVVTTQRVFGSKRR